AAEGIDDGLGLERLHHRAGDRPVHARRPAVEAVGERVGVLAPRALPGPRQHRRERRIAARLDRAADVAQRAALARIAPRTGRPARLLALARALVVHRLLRFPG